MTPTSSGTFTSGVWTGSVTVLEPVSNMYLRADNGLGHLGNGNLFAAWPLALSDSDGDGIPDIWSWQYFGGITNANPNAVCSNGVNTIFEAYLAGFTPNEKNARFGITEHNPLQKLLRWNSVSGRVYSVYWTTNLLSNFQCLESNIPWTRGSFTNSTTEPCGYYKIDVRMAP